jgi:hypothetical protein
LNSRLTIIPPKIKFSAINLFFGARLVFVFNGLFLDCAENICCIMFVLAGFLEHVLQECLQAHPSRLQSGACYVVASPRKCGAGESESCSLLCSGEYFSDFFCVV